MVAGMTFGSLFAGIGGFDLGLERAGMHCKWQCELDPYARRVLEKHWPDVRRWDDVRTFPGPGDWEVDLICGGFPCQDISNAGKRAGIDGEQSGLWSEFARIIGVLRPRYVLVENVAALLGRGFGRVLGDLSSLGYDAEWEVIPAALLGLAHARNRLFLVAYSDFIGRQAGERVFDRNARGSRRKEVGIMERPPLTERGRSGRIWAVPDSGIHGMANGAPHRVDRIRCLGNTIVPQIAEWIGRRILEASGDQP